MKGESLLYVFGQAAQIMKTMADLTRQVRKQGGLEEDIKWLGDENVLQCVAKVLARAGRLRRPISVCGGGEFGDETIYEVHLNGIVGINFAGLMDAIQSWGCRLATATELDDMLENNPDLLSDEAGLIVVGERCNRPHPNEYSMDDGMYWAIKGEKTGRGLTISPEYFPGNMPIDDKFRFAMIFSNTAR